MEGKRGFPIFVGNIPSGASRKWIVEIFGKFGKICGIFISSRHSKGSDSYFGFVRFLYKSSAEKAILQVNGMKIDKVSLTVHFPLFEINGSSILQPRSLPGLGEKELSGLWPPVPGVGLGPNVGLSVNKVKPFAQVVSDIPLASNSTFNLAAKKRVAGSAIKLDWLDKCAVAFVCNTLVLPKISEVLLREFKEMRSVRIMGSHQLLIEFISSNVRDEMLSLGIWGEVFDHIKPWNGELVGYDRVLWLECSGIPIHSWSHDIFLKIANLWGSLLRIDDRTKEQSRFDKAFILISTKLENIDNAIEIEVDNKIYDVKIVEVHNSHSRGSDLAVMSGIDKFPSDDTMLREGIVESSFSGPVNREEKRRSVEVNDQPLVEAVPMDLSVSKAFMVHSVPQSGSSNSWDKYCPNEVLNHNKCPIQFDESVCTSVESKEGIDNEAFSGAELNYGQNQQPICHKLDHSALADVLSPGRGQQFQIVGPSKLVEGTTFFGQEDNGIRFADQPAILESTAISNGMEISDNVSDALPTVSEDEMRSSSYSRMVVDEAELSKNPYVGGFDVCTDVRNLQSNKVVNSGEVTEIVAGKRKKDCLGVVKDVSNLGHPVNLGPCDPVSVVASVHRSNIEAGKSVKAISDGKLMLDGTIKNSVPLVSKDHQISFQSALCKDRIVGGSESKENSIVLSVEGTEEASQVTRNQESQVRNVGVWLRSVDFKKELLLPAHIHALKGSSNTAMAKLEALRYRLEEGISDTIELGLAMGIEVSVEVQKVIKAIVFQRQIQAMKLIYANG